MKEHQSITTSSQKYSGVVHESKAGKNVFKLFYEMFSNLLKQCCCGQLYV